MGGLSQPTPVRPALARVWDAVDRLVDSAAHEGDILDHRLAPFAARLARTRALDVPQAFEAMERSAALAALTAPITLARVRAAVDGDLIVVKGPEVAARYPDAALRGFGDLDLLSRDPRAAHTALIEAGAVPVGDPALFLGIHHLRPLAWPDLPLAIEIHTRPKWADELEPLSVDEVFELAVPAAVEVKGYLAPSAAAHAVLIAVHSWAHEPLRRLRDMVDVAALLGEADRGEAREIASSWRVARLWRTTERAIDALFLDGPAPRAMRLWAQNLARARGRTVLEHHIERWLSDFSIMPPQRAVRRLPATFVAEVRPGAGETWSEKLRRVALALRNGPRRRFEHDEQLTRHRRR